MPNTKAQFMAHEFNHFTEKTEQHYGSSQFRVKMVIINGVKIETWTDLDDNHDAQATVHGLVDKDEGEFFQVELIMHRSGDEDEDAEPENCAAPLTCKEKVSSLKRFWLVSRMFGIFQLKRFKAG